MRRKKISNSIFIFFISLFFFGFSSIQVERIEDGLTKSKVLSAWSRQPDKIYKNKDTKYNADEVWIYRYPDSTVDKYYFKGEFAVGKEHVTYGDF